MNSTLIYILISVNILLSIIAVVLYFVRSKNSTEAEISKNLTYSEDRIEKQIRDSIEVLRTSTERQGKDNREELSNRIDSLSRALTYNLSSFSESQAKQWELMHQRNDAARETLQKSFVDFTDSQKNQWEAMQRLFNEMSQRNEQHLDAIRKVVEELSQRNEQKIDSIKASVEEKLRILQEGNEKKLDEMRGVVDEKLHKTLEDRLNQSFKLVSDQLEKVYTNLGEMRNLSKDMGDIKNIFKNVKTRGTWGEVQLGSLLEQMLTPEQYEKNVKVHQHSDDVVEFAIKLPGPDEKGTHIWLPIDSKFPMEDYERMMDAVERGDSETMTAAAHALELRVVSQAKSIRDKYINPPVTTDFAVLFVPVESLFAEILRRPGLHEKLQQEYRVTVAGPTTLASLLNSLRMGFRTLAIQKSSGEVWKLLGAVKKQFGTFADTLKAVESNIERAAKGVRDATNRTGMIRRRLERVEELPAQEAAQLLPEGTMPEPIDEDEVG